jgi:hypothetical protein
MKIDSIIFIIPSYILILIRANLLNIEWAVYMFFFYQSLLSKPNLALIIILTVSTNGAKKGLVDKNNREKERIPSCEYSTPFSARKIGSEPMKNPRVRPSIRYKRKISNNALFSFELRIN